jgi:hypothetical protein
MSWLNGINWFEAGMLFCFGLAWPVNIYKSIKSRSTKGKSIMFSYVVLVGYISGTIFKLTSSLDIVLWLYIFNFVAVSVDLVLYYMNKNHERQIIRDAELQE